MALLDNGAQINTIMPRYVSDHSLLVGLITELLGAKVTCMGLGRNAETIDPFSSHVVSVKAGRAYTGECINIMVQALLTEDGSLPQGLTVQNTYTKLRQGK